MNDEANEHLNRLSTTRDQHEHVMCRRASVYMPNQHCFEHFERTLANVLRQQAETTHAPYTVDKDEEHGKQRSRAAGTPRKARLAM